MQKTKVIAVNLPVGIYAKVNKIAEGLRLSPSDIVTQALQTMLEKEHYQKLVGQLDRTPHV